MSTAEILANREYKYGWVTDIESETIPRGLSEDTVRLISAKKDEPEWMLNFRLKAYRHWLTMEEPRKWPNVSFPEIDYQDMIYYSAPKQKATVANLDEVDPELLKTFEKLASLCLNKSSWPAWRLTQCLIRFQSRPLTKRNSRSMA